MQVHSPYNFYFNSANTANTATLATQEKNEKSIKQDNVKTKENLYEFIKEYSNIQNLDSSLIIGNDKLHKGMMEYQESIKNQAKNTPISSQDEFQANLDFLFNQMENILLQGFNENMNDKEFQNLLSGYMMTNRVVSKQSYEDSTQDALQALSRLKNGNKSDDFKQKLSDYMTNSNALATSISGFFYQAEYFNKIPQNQKNTIQNALEKVASYLFNQGGALDNKSFKLGDATISWNGDDLPFKDYYKGEVQIVFTKSASFASTFDSSQTFFEVLEQRDKLEKENQELKNKEASIVYGISQNAFTKTDSQSDSIIQTLLKESKEA